MGKAERNHPFGFSHSGRNWAEAEEKGRHEIIAGGKNVTLPSKEHSLVLNLDDVNKDIQHDLDSQGIAKTAREEQLRARN